jgi:hypothetical protein
LKRNTNTNLEQFIKVNGLVVSDREMEKLNFEMVRIMKANGILAELMAKVLSNGRSQAIFIQAIGMEIIFMVMVNL